jgi:hypothetical protein
MSTYSPIATQTLGSAAASITFTSIPQGYTDLVLVCNGSAATGANNYLQFNSDTSSLYSYTRLISDGTTVNQQSNRGSNQTKITMDGFAYWNTTAGAGNNIIQIMNYSNATKNKTVLVRANATQGVDTIVGLYRSTSAITSITFLSDSTMTAGSTFSLYGIQVGTAAQKAQGGNIVTSDGTYVYHTFTSSGSFIPNQALTADYLVVAGGGGGGAGYVATGAGAGGLRSTVTATGGGGSLESTLSLNAQPYPVIIGAGGAGGISQGNGTNGGNSVFGTITAAGGGAGTYAVASNAGSGIAGGSGSGSANFAVSTAGGAGTANQGYRGGNITVSNGPWPAGTGGGGAGAIGGNGTGGASSTTAIGSAGGNGVAVSISGTSVTYAGGGGGTNYYSSTGGYAGGTGGGGAGSAQGNGTAGTVNTGGGGGGGGNFNAGYTGGAGGSGIVIIRYAI